MINALALLLIIAIIFPQLVGVWLAQVVTTYKYHTGEKNDNQQ